ncbi:MAG TPA: hypothetical protein VF813_10555 [Anaerolineaceae bacterium]
MVNSFATLERAGTVVFETINLTMAAAVCDQLEDAGVPARLGKVNRGFAVLVPAEFAAQSRGLLVVRPKTGEIFCYVN